MKLENNFTIDAPVEKAWEALNTPETVAPCFPGATLTNYEGDSFTGTVKVKLGPISMTYKGKGTYVTRDEDAHEVVIDASGRDSRGNGTASAKVTAALAADGPDRTAVSMVTDMTITGKPAQFGRGVISDVADKIIGQFSACVARKLAPAASAEVPVSEVPVSEVAAPASEAMSDVPAPAATPQRSAPVPAAGSGASPDAVAERSASNASASNGLTVTPTAPAPSGTSEADAPASTSMATAGTAVRPGTSQTSAAQTSAAQTSAAQTSAPRSSAPQKSGLQSPVRSEVDAIDLLDTAGAPVLKRLAPVAGGGLFLLLVVLLVRRLRAG